MSPHSASWVRTTAQAHLLAMHLHSISFIWIVAKHSLLQSTGCSCYTTCFTWLLLYLFLRKALPQESPMPQTDGSQGNDCVHIMLFLLYSCTLTQDSRLGRVLARPGSAAPGQQPGTQNKATLSQHNFAISKWE